MGLRKIVDNLKPTFSKGGKLSFLASTFDAFETFLFVPNTTTAKGAHIRDCNDMKRTMIVVVAALLAKNYFPGLWGKLSLSLILAGAVGNLIDRALLGFVTDMFETTFMDFAVFNVADICVVVGGFLMVFYVLFLWDKDKEGGHDPA